MCGRYLRRSDKQEIAERFRLGVLPDGFVMPPDFNIAPTTFQPVIRLNRDTNERELVMMRWGLIPFFAKKAEDFKGFSTINAMAETVAEKALWRAPFEKRRCLVPADGFYEWKVVETVIEGKRGQKKQKVKKPYAFMLNNKQPFAFAGLWDAWRDPVTGEWLQTFAIITTTPNEVTGEVHNRMPVILHPRDYDKWLERGESSDRAHKLQLRALLKPYEAELVFAEPANPAVGNVRNNGPEMLDPDGPEASPPNPEEEQNGN